MHLRSSTNLISQETEPLQEVQSQFEFVSHSVPLHLGANCLGLLAHTLLPTSQIDTSAKMFCYNNS